jgi:hypothetical protein
VIVTEKGAEPVQLSQALGSLPVARLAGQTTLVSPACHCSSAIGSFEVCSASNFTGPTT